MYKLRARAAVWVIIGLTQGFLSGVPVASQDHLAQIEDDSVKKPNTELSSKKNLESVLLKSRQAIAQGNSVDAFYNLESAVKDVSASNAAVDPALLLSSSILLARLAPQCGRDPQQFTENAEDIFKRSYMPVKPQHESWINTDIINYYPDFDRKPGIDTQKIEGLLKKKEFLSYSQFPNRSSRMSWKAFVNMHTTGGAYAMPGPKKGVPTVLAVAQDPLLPHVVSLGADGRLLSTDRIHTDATQIDGIFKSFENWVETRSRTANKKPPRLVIYVHGGLTDEDSAIHRVLQQRAWWLANDVYPVFIIWHTGVDDYLREHPNEWFDIGAKKVMLGLTGPLLDDGDVEWLANKLAKSKWEWMKMKALKSCERLGDIAWDDARNVSSDLPGGSLLESRLALERNKNPNLEIHLIGHSAGSILCAALMESLHRDGLDSKSVSFLAPALRVGDFQKLVLPNAIQTRVTVFNLCDKRESEDECVFGTIKYHKSLLYLVSRSMEDPAFGESTKHAGFVPLLGLELFADEPMTPASDTVRQAIGSKKGAMYFAPSGGPMGGQTDAKRHGEFPDDPATMDSVASVILNGRASTSFSTRE